MTFVRTKHIYGCLTRTLGRQNVTLVAASLVALKVGAAVSEGWKSRRHGLGVSRGWEDEVFGAGE